MGEPNQTTLMGRAKSKQHSSYCSCTARKRHIRCNSIDTIQCPHFASDAGQPTACSFVCLASMSGLILMGHEKTALAVLLASNTCSLAHA
jgi:hypothetical protein